MRRHCEKTPALSQVSIHASVKDATYTKSLVLFSNWRFNPRICKRCDPIAVHFLSISSCFNPRICKRCDYNMESTFPRITCFNPRICKRCDVCSFRQPSDSICFNPRICKRCDRNAAGNPNTPVVSIHASVKDATCLIVNMTHKIVFQSTHL